MLAPFHILQNVDCITYYPKNTLFFPYFSIKIHNNFCYAFLLVFLPCYQKQTNLKILCFLIEVQNTHNSPVSSDLPPQSRNVGAMIIPVLNL